MKLPHVALMVALLCTSRLLGHTQLTTSSTNAPMLAAAVQLHETLKHGEQLNLTATSKTNQGSKSSFPMVRDYQSASQPSIDVALESIRQAKLSKNKDRIQAAQYHLQLVWVGLRSYRTNSVTGLCLSLNNGQIALLDEPQNQLQANAEFNWHASLAH